MRRLRAFFHQRGFTEVETPVRWHETLVEAYVDPVPVPGVRGRQEFLLASPELHMKWLLATRVPPGSHLFQVTRAFRCGESGPRHNPEFTLVEWYQWGARMEEGMALLEALVRDLLQAPKATRTSYRQAFRQHAGLDPVEAPLELLRDALRHCAVSDALLHQTDRGGCLDALWALRVEPRLGVQMPEIVYHFPPHQAALARLEQGPPPVARRFELYLDGVELANGYEEERDVSELRRRMVQANRIRRQRDAPVLPLPEEFFRTLDETGLPPCCGVALGWDRLVMVATGCETIGQVRPFVCDQGSAP